MNFKYSDGIFKLPYENAIEISEEEFKYLHKAYWNLIAENNLKLKPPISPVIVTQCFACEYANRQKNKIHKNSEYHLNTCHFCPIKEWKSNRVAAYEISTPRYMRYENTCECLSSSSLYSKWKNAYSPSIKGFLAIQILKLKWEDIQNED